MAYKVQIIGVRASLFIDSVRQLGCGTEIIDTPVQISPDSDICLAAGVHYIIQEKYLKIPRLGIWGFHESALSEGRGCAPIQWTILKGMDTLTVSFFELVKEVDAGRILGQESAKLTKNMVLEDIRELSIELCKKLLDKYLINFLDGKVSPYKQAGCPSYYRRRTPDDSQLDISKPLKDLWDLIRVCDNDEFPAWFKIDGEKIILKRYKQHRKRNLNEDKRK